MARQKPQWKQNCQQRQEAINAYARQLYCPLLKETDKIQLWYPWQMHRYLQQHPCADCGAEPFCDIPCPVYLQWYNAKIHSLRVKLGRQ